MRSVVSMSTLLIALGVTGQAQATESGAVKSPVSLIDTVTSQDIDSVLMRPDGAMVAYVVHHADLTSRLVYPAGYQPVELGGVNIFNRLPQFSTYEAAFGIAFDPNQADIVGRFLYLKAGVRL